MDCLYLAALLVLTCGLERLHGRPFIASFVGHLVARVLGGCQITGAAGACGREAFYEVTRLPAVGFCAAAQTWGEVILVTPAAYRSERLLAPELLAHERCHVAQYRRLTSFGFWGLYLAAWLGGLLRYRDPFRAYWAVALEREARAAAAAKTTHPAPTRHTVVCATFHFPPQPPR